MAFFNFKKPKEKGFTLMEIVLFAALLGILLVALFSVLGSFLKSRQRYQNLSRLQDASVSIFNQLTQEIHWSYDVEINEQTESLDELILFRDLPELGEQEIVFREENGRLFKNEAPLTDSRIQVQTFKIVNRAPPGLVPCLEIQLGLVYPSRQDEASFENKTTISLRKSEFSSGE